MEKYVSILVSLQYDTTRKIERALKNWRTVGFRLPHATKYKILIKEKNSRVIREGGTEYQYIEVV